MDGKQFSLITIGMIILLGIVGLGFMQMNTNNSLNMISDRLVAVEKQVDQDLVNTNSATGTNETGYPCEGDCDSGIREIVGYTTDFEIMHPEGFYTALVDNAFIGGQKDLLITSKPGTLFVSSGGPAVPTSAEFTEGIQFEIRRLADRQVHVSRDEMFRDTKNPLVRELVIDCDGVGCPAREFIINVNESAYVMEVKKSANYSPADMDRDIETVISSIKLL